MVSGLEQPLPQSIAISPFSLIASYILKIVITLFLVYIQWYTGLIPALCSMIIPGGNCEMVWDTEHLGLQCTKARFLPTVLSHKPLITFFFLSKMFFILVLW